MIDFGFGCMRLPKTDKNDDSSVDIELFKKMVDKYMESGFNYFDTAFGYHEGVSEVAVRKAVVERYPRESFVIADKLPIYMMPKSEDEFQPTFDTQLERLGVDYIDYYMLHNASGWTANAFENLDAFKFVREKKAEGKIKHLGISSHDDAEFLEKLLPEHPEIEFVQLQVNYLDWENDSIQSRKCVEVCRKYNKDVIVMEPVRGGTLSNLPEDIAKILTDYDSSKSLASWALRFCRGIEGVQTVLSGMSDLEQVEDNLSSMTNFEPLNDEELELINQVVDQMNSKLAVPCTYCKYCVPYCPINIPIPKYFEFTNTEKLINPDGFSVQVQGYLNMTNRGAPKASECLECGACAKICPQQLDIPRYMKTIVVETLEKDVPW